jgi:hypothetical protein
MQAAVPIKDRLERNTEDYAFSSTDYAQATSSGQANYRHTAKGTGPVFIDSFSLSS